MTLSRRTRDHEEIQRWAESHGALPAEVASTEKNGQTGILRFEFPKAKNHNDSALKEISWEDFFEKFDENNLELIYQEKTADGDVSNFNKLVYPEVKAETKKSTRSSGSGSAKKSSTTSKEESTSKKHSHDTAA